MSQEPAAKKMQILNTDRGDVIADSAGTAVMPPAASIIPIERKMEDVKLREETSEKPRLQTDSSPKPQTNVVDLGRRHLNGLQEYCVTGDERRLVIPGRMLIGIANENGDNCLHLAIRGNILKVQKNILEVVLSIRDDKKESFDRIINLQNKEYQAPIHEAVLQKNMKILAVLLEVCHANPTLRDKYGNNVVHLAVMQSPEIVKMVIQIALRLVNGKDVVRELLGQGRYDGYTPLEYALKEKRLDEGKVILSCTDPERLNIHNNINGMTPFQYAVHEGMLEVADLMIKTGKVDVNLKCKAGRRALEFVPEGAGELKKLLEDAGAIEKGSESEEEEEEEENDDGGFESGESSEPAMEE